MYDPKMHRVCIMHDVVWLHHMFYQKSNSVGELNTDHICVGNWLCMTKGVSRFIEAGEGISNEEDKEPQEIHSPTNDSDKFEDQPVGNDIVEEENSTGENECPTDRGSPVTYTTTVSGQVSKPQHTYLKKLARLH